MLGTRIWLTALLFWPVLGWTQEAAPARARIRIPRVSRVPQLEDFLNGSEREAEARATDFVERYPKNGAAPPRETIAYISYDDKNLYVIVRCKDEPAAVRAHMSKRDDLGDDDTVHLYLDTFHDRRRAYLFGINPLGIQEDAIFTEGQSTDYSFDTLWYSEGRITSDGYLVRFAVPFRSLRFRPRDTQKWRIAISRYIPRMQESATWPLISDRVQGFTPQLATLEGLEGISSGRSLQFIPYVTAGRARLLDSSLPAGPAFRTENDLRGGLDGKTVFHDALTLDYTLNPDFSQVESDDPQVIINQRYEVYFPEKRPFFTENSAFFSTPTRLLFSRRIQDPEFGARLTGKIHRWAIGVLAADDRAPGRGREAGDPLAGRRAENGVVRVVREVGKDSSIGFFASSRDFASSSNRVFALDTRLKLNPNWVLTGQVTRSYDRPSGGPSRTGSSSLANINHSGRHLLYATSYVDISPTFYARLGFIPRNDIRQVISYAFYSWKPKKGMVTNYWVNSRGLSNWNRASRIQDWSGSAGGGMDFRFQTAFYVRRSRTYELFQGQGFIKDGFSAGAYNTSLKWLRVEGSYSQGRRVNYHPAAGLAPFLADGRSADLSLTLRPATGIRITQSYLYDWLATRANAPRFGLPASTSIYNNHIMRTKVNWQFNRELSLRAIFDYSAVLPNARLIGQERAKRLAADILLTYLIHPGTAFYIGYTDVYENLALAPDSQSLIRTPRPGTNTARQFFAKVSYLFRF
jgi:hypothetical protein